MPDEPSFTPSRERLVLSIAERPHSLLLLPRGQETRFSLFSIANRGNLLHGHRHFSFIKILPRRTRDVFDLDRSASRKQCGILAFIDLSLISIILFARNSLSRYRFNHSRVLFTDTLYIYSCGISINGSVVHAHRTDRLQDRVQFLKIH